MTNSVHRQILEQVYWRTKRQIWQQVGEQVEEQIYEQVRRQLRGSGDLT